MHRIPILTLIVFAFLVSSVAAPLSASADGVIIVDPPVCDPVCPDPMLIAEQRGRGVAEAELSRVRERAALLEHELSRLKQQSTTSGRGRRHRR